MSKKSCVSTLFLLMLISALDIAAFAPVEAVSLVTVTIDDTGYTPQEVTILVGASVLWRNDDSKPHTSTSDAGLWDSRTIQPGATWPSEPFTTTGIFNYHSAAPSDQMSGKVIVVPSGSNTLFPETINNGLLSGFILSILFAAAVTLWLNYPSARARARAKMR